MSEASPGGEPEADPLASLAEQRRRHDFDRSLMLSDGVFAIAITLAALEIRPPEGLVADPAGLLHAMAPALLTYAISFLVIAAYWFAHRRIFAMLRRVDTAIIWLNLLLLGLVALQPAGVGMLTRHGPRGGALELYLGLIVVIGLVQALLWAHAAFVGKLLDPGVGQRYRISQLVLGLILPLLTSSMILFAAGSGSPGFFAAAFVVVGGMAVTRRLIGRRIDR